jgi:hypothetical protein
MFDTEDEKSFSVDLKMFDTEDFNASDPDDCCHHIEKVRTSIQMFSIFIRRDVGEDREGQKNPDAIN